MQSPEAAYSDFLRRYTPPADNRPRDTLAGRYRIELSSPLPEFDTKNARAFAVSDILGGEGAYYALVCRPGTMQRLALVEKYKAIDHPNLVRLMAAGAAPLSQPQEERYVLVYKRPAGRKLSQMLAEPGASFSEPFVTRMVIAPLTAAISQLGEQGITHGAVNPDMIFIGESLVLGECLSEPCGASQPFYYEPVERMQAMQVAKGDGDLFVDYYAMAAMVVQLLHGAAHYAEMTPQGLAAMILKEGAYAAMTRQKDNPGAFEDFLRGTLNLNKTERWGVKHVQPWLDGKRFHVLTPPAPTEGIRPFEHDGKTAHTRRELAAQLYADWDHIPEVLQSGQLTHWATVSLRNKELGEHIARIARSAEAAGRNETQLFEQLMALLVALDSNGPIRFSTLSFHADGLAPLCLELINTRAEKELQLLARFVEYSMINVWTDAQRKGSETRITESANTSLVSIDRARMSIRNAGMGFGVERMLYELAPGLPCQSPLLAGAYVDSLSALLKKLDQVASAQQGNDPFDRHVAAFAAGKMGMQHEMRIPELDGLPALAGNRGIIALRLLTMAQEKANLAYLPGLTHWVALRLAPALDTLRSKTLRARIKSVLGHHVDSGLLRQVCDVVINSEYAGVERDGFRNASATYHDSVVQIAACRRGDGLEDRSARLGFFFAKVFSYIALLISCISVFRGLL